MTDYDADRDHADERAEQHAELHPILEQDTDLIDDWRAAYAASIEADRAALRAEQAREDAER